MIDERLAEPVIDPDWIDRGALVGLVVDAGEERVVALGNYVRLRDPRPPKPPSRWPTPTRGGASGRGWSSSSLRVPRATESSASSAR